MKLAKKTLVLRPSKRLLVDLIVVIFAVALLICVRPNVGDRTPFGGKPHGLLGVLAFYLVMTGIALYAGADLVRAIRHGGAAVKRRWNKRTVTFETGRVEFMDILALREDEGILITIEITAGPAASIATIAIFVMDESTDSADEANESPRKTIDIAWEAERASEILVFPPNAPGRYKLGVRVDSAPGALWSLTTRWTVTNARKNS